ncbi:ParD-like family protein [Aestuariirhabdus sp. Z084]|uniref:ParD-like family protein n=1 Tax=Aestuariirhabdus haliotis TaxID=2918751 RepID=UPI00201B38DA|nr:ParD-like family protein [Aestuariirhabdus haliotis]MCL6415790.1 ParD-like family protein [Aestuariirhabdus haliotis]MCL6419707.1 ParD-like family protein [Aestuariirhabdus haliotis]
MAKASSPVRLQSELMESAKLAGERLHRSTAEQIEYWASIGRSVSHLVNPDSLLDVTTGLAKLKIEPVSSPVIDPDVVFAALERDRASGVLQLGVTSSAKRYQVSSRHPGMLEQIDELGEVTVGQFDNGQFVPIKGVD